MTGRFGHRHRGSWKPGMDRNRDGHQSPHTRLCQPAGVSLQYVQAVLQSMSIPQIDQDSPLRHMLNLPQVMGWLVGQASALETCLGPSTGGA